VQMIDRRRPEVRVHLSIFIDFPDPYSIIDDSDSLEPGVWFGAILRGWDTPHNDALGAILGICDISLREVALNTLSRSA
jgi:hypothetical protein